MPDEKDYVEVNEWKQVVRKAKKCSTSSMFSMRDYSVHKSALESELIVEALVQFYNNIIKCNDYPKIWLKVADVMIEKRKGPQLKMLRILETIEAVLQLVMRACLGIRMNERVELDNRLSKHNYGSRKAYSIEKALLEKRLTIDHEKNGGG